MARVDDILDNYCNDNRVDSKYFDKNIDNLRETLQVGEIPRKVFRAKIKGTFGLKTLVLVTNKNLYLLKENSKKFKCRDIPLDAVKNIDSAEDSGVINLAVDQKILDEVKPRKKTPFILVMVMILLFPLFMFLPFGPFGFSFGYFGMMRFARRTAYMTRGGQNNPFAKFAIIMLIIIAAMIVLMLISNVIKKHSWNNIRAKDKFEFDVEKETVADDFGTIKKSLNQFQEDRKYEEIANKYDGNLNPIENSEEESRFKKENLKPLNK